MGNKNSLNSINSDNKFNIRYFQKYKVTKVTFGIITVELNVENISSNKKISFLLNYYPSHLMTSNHTHKKLFYPYN